MANTHYMDKPKEAAGGTEAARRSAIVWFSRQRRPGMEGMQDRDERLFAGAMRAAGFCVREVPLAAMHPSFADASIRVLRWQRSCG